MSKNYMEHVAQMLGVEMGEIFSIDDGNIKYKFEDDGIYYWFARQNVWDLASYKTVMGLLNGKHKIRKISQQKHTGLEDVEEGTTFYTLFGPSSGFELWNKKYIREPVFSDRTIRGNWERRIIIKNVWRRLRLC